MAKTNEDKDAKDINSANDEKVVKDMNAWLNDAIHMPAVIFDRKGRAYHKDKKGASIRADFSFGEGKKVIEEVATDTIERIEREARLSQLEECIKVVREKADCLPLLTKDDSDILLGIKYALQVLSALKDNAKT